MTIEEARKILDIMDAPCPCDCHIHVFGKGPKCPCHPINQMMKNLPDMKEQKRKRPGKKAK